MDEFDENELTIEECEKAFEIELEALDIITNKVKKAFEEERRKKLKYKKSIQSLGSNKVEKSKATKDFRLIPLNKHKKYNKVHQPCEA